MKSTGSLNVPPPTDGRNPAFLIYRVESLDDEERDRELEFRSER
jgi:hypothetical protein